MFWLSFATAIAAGVIVEIGIGKKMGSGAGSVGPSYWSIGIAGNDPGPRSCAVFSHAGGRLRSVMLLS